LLYTSRAKANLVHFNIAFSGLGVEDGMPLQGTFKSFSHSVSAQAWVKCLHIFRHKL